MEHRHQRYRSLGGHVKTIVTSIAVTYSNVVEDSYRGQMVEARCFDTATQSHRNTIKA
eukprot:COSAG02_NODE_31590_length_531_cov_0.611111_1_plen_57_part_10